MNSPLYDFLGLPPIRRNIFVSYHHRNEQGTYNTFSNYFSDELGIYHDDSLEREEDSDNAAYLNRKIREEYIFGTSATIVLLGSETHKRRWIDWEIHATLEYEHGLLGVILPTAPRDIYGNIIVPSRFHANFQTGYAHMIQWTDNAQVLYQSIETAISKSRNKSLIRNADPKMMRSLS